jgi:hypothetical protein
MFALNCNKMTSYLLSFLNVNIHCSFLPTVGTNEFSCEKR